MDAVMVMDMDMDMDMENGVPRFMLRFEGVCSMDGCGVGRVMYNNPGGHPLCSLHAVVTNNLRVGSQCSFNRTWGPVLCQQCADASLKGGQMK
jgi:hypothetical protein